MEKKIKRGNIFYTTVTDNEGSEQGGERPFLILQNNVGNKWSPTVIGAFITSQEQKPNIPTHVEINVIRKSVILLEQVRTLDKKKLREYIGSLTPSEMDEVDVKLLVSLGINPFTLCPKWLKWLKAKCINIFV